MTVRLKHVYILFLLIVVILLVYLAQGISQQGTKITKEIEFNRVDGRNELLGNITRISATIHNNDIINHNYTVSAFVDSKLYDSKTVEVLPDMPFTYSITIPVEKKYNADNVLIDDPMHVINFTVYGDDSKKPIDQIEFKFD
jgi:hypothetical protein